MAGVGKILLDASGYINMAIQLIKTVRSLDEAIRKSNGLEPPEPLPENWEELLKANDSTE